MAGKSSGSSKSSSGSKGLPPALEKFKFKKGGGRVGSSKK